MNIKNLTRLLAVLLLLFLLAACGESEHGSTEQPVSRQRPQIPDGDPDRGEELIRQYGCGSCHQIPGIRAADGDVGPPLTNWADRQYIAGALPNTPENLIHWIRFPQAVEPGTVMPNLDVTEEEARDIAAYLYTLTDEGQFTDVFSTPQAAIGGLFSGSSESEAEGEESTGEEQSQQQGEVPNTGQQSSESQGGQQLVQQGEQVFSNNCAQCHGQNGEGQVGPALAGNDFVTSQDPAPVIDTVLHGRGQMPAFQEQLSTEQIAAVVSFIRNAWSNSASTVAPDQIEGGQSQSGSSSGGEGQQGGQGQQQGGQSGEQQTTTIDLVARNRAFDKNTLTVPAGSSVTINMTNQDSVPHNFAVYQDSSAGRAIFTGQTFTGPGQTITMQFTAPAEPGTYYFRCDIHPFMNGTLTVVE